MIILELIKKSATILNIEQVLEDDNVKNFVELEEANTLSKNPTLARMFELAKLVINEVASYCPIVNEIELTSTDKKIFFNKITRLGKIVSVKNKHGYVKFDMRDNYMCLEQDGTYTIVYHQYPQTISMTYPINTSNGAISDDLLVAGLNSYYCLATGLYAEYNVYNAQYVDRLSRIKNLKVFSMPSRSWND